MKPLKYSWFGHEKKLFRTKTLNYPKLLSPTKDWGEHLPGTFRNEFWVWSKHIFYVTLYKDKDKNKDADRINETLLVCYIFGILTTQAIQVWWWLSSVTDVTNVTNVTSVTNMTNMGCDPRILKTQAFQVWWWIPSVTNVTNVTNMTNMTNVTNVTPCRPTPWLSETL